ncbi:Hsp20/alpha crystallin family protein [Lacisediminihabitans sp.]|jgi:HSP20 family protein|uniref:Hsp20/alpha crystallin family protein n=1 Tax=Lacisediminihabitans sp. TaxID=2787631 RepID=UPI002F947718
MAVYVDTFRNVDGVLALQFDGHGHPWSVPTTALREDDRVIICAEIAGVERESTEVDIDIAGKCLTIRVNGSRADAATARRLISEWASVPVTPELGAAEALDLDGMTASYEDGSLRIEIPVVSRPVKRRVSMPRIAAVAAVGVSPLSFNAVSPFPRR